LAELPASNQSLVQQVCIRRRPGVFWSPPGRQTHVDLRHRPADLGL